MLNIVVIDDYYNKRMEYTWDSIEDFMLNMNIGGNIPMLYDRLIEVNTDDFDLDIWQRNTDYNSVNDLYEACKLEIDIWS